MAAHLPPIVKIAQFRLKAAAQFLLRGAAAIEPAFCARRVDRALRIAFKLDRAAPGTRAQRGNSRQKGLRIGMRRLVKQRGRVAAFNHLPQIHHRNPAAQKAHDIQIVAHEQQGHTLFTAYLVQQLQDGGLHRHIKRRGGLVKDLQARLHHHRARNTDTRLLPSRELMREAAQKLQRQIDRLRGFTDLLM